MWLSWLPRGDQSSGVTRKGGTLKPVFWGMLTEDQEVSETDSKGGRKESENTGLNRAGCSSRSGGG